MSLFKTKSESALDSLVLNPDFAVSLELEKHNKVVENFILRHLQTDIQATNLADFLETVSASIEPITTAHEHTNPPFVSISPISTNPETTVGSSSTSHITSPPPTPHTPYTLATPTPSTPPGSTLPKAMAARFSPLALPQNLHDMPADYQSKIPMFDGTPQGVSAQQHIDKMANFFDLYEIDDEDVTMRLFVQTFRGEVRKWFRALAARSIPTLEELQRNFLE